MIDGDRIAAVSQQALQVDDAHTIDAAKRVVLSGLIDAPVHVTAVLHNFFALAQQPAALTCARASHILYDL